jgi:hypothetical protein
MNLLRSRLIIQVSFVFALFQSVAIAQVPEPIDQDNFSLEDSRNFSNFSNNDSAIKMSLAQVPEEFDCPLFSNTPYKDILSALDGLQTSINVFPKCGANDKSTDAMTSLATDLRQRIFDAKSLQDKNETKKFGISAEQILSSATRLQDLISKLSTSGQSDCYKTEDSKKLIFSINDTFQSIAPLALDFVAKNPALSSTLAPYMSTIAGAQAISKGLSVLEFAIQYVPTLNMDIPENRVAVIKNTCSFMKVYNKIEFLTLDRASRIKKINQDFDKKILASRMMSQSLMAAAPVALTLSSNPTDSEIIKIKDKSERYQKILGKAADELTAQSMQQSNISICSVVKTVYSMKISAGIAADLNQLSQLLKKQDQVAFKKTKLEEFEGQMSQEDTLKSTQACAEMGQEWLAAQNEALAEIKNIIAEYDSLSQTDSSLSVAKIKISREDKKQSDLQDNKAKLNIFTDLSVFEPGELAKRMRGMPKYLFNGPQGSWYSIKQYKQNGPVYDLLHDNETYFNKAMGEFNKQVNFFKSFEMRQSELEVSNARRLSPAAQDLYYKKLFQNMINFPHLSTDYVKVGSYEHRQLCDHSKLAIKSYVEVTDHLISNEYLCKMIDPVLKEAEVSMWLKRYCQNSKGLVNNTDVKAGYKELARPLFEANGPKFQIELIMQKYENLGCE